MLYVSCYSKATGYYVTDTDDNVTTFVSPEEFRKLRKTPGVFINGIMESRGRYECRNSANYAKFVAMKKSVPVVRQSEVKESYIPASIAPVLDLALSGSCLKHDSNLLCSKLYIGFRAHNNVIFSIETNVRDIDAVLQILKLNFCFRCVNSGLSLPFFSELLTRECHFDGVRADSTKRFLDSNPDYMKLCWGYSIRRSCLDEALNPILFELFTIIRAYIPWLTSIISGYEDWENINSHRFYPCNEATVELLRVQYADCYYLGKLDTSTIKQLDINKAVYRSLDSVLALKGQHHYTQWKNSLYMVTL